MDERRLNDMAAWVRDTFHFECNVKALREPTSVFMMDLCASFLQTCVGVTDEMLQQMPAQMYRSVRHQDEDSSENRSMVAQEQWLLEMGDRYQPYLTSAVILQTNIFIFMSSMLEDLRVGVPLARGDLCHPSSATVCRLITFMRACTPFSQEFDAAFKQVVATIDEDLREINMLQKTTEAARRHRDENEANLNTATRADEQRALRQQALEDQIVAQISELDVAEKEEASEVKRQQEQRDLAVELRKERARLDEETTAVEGYVIRDPQEFQTRLATFRDKVTRIQEDITKQKMTMDALNAARAQYRKCRATLEEIPAGSRRLRAAINKAAEALTGELCARSEIADLEQKVNDQRTSNAQADSDLAELKKQRERAQHDHDVPFADMQKAEQQTRAELERLRSQSSVPGGAAASAQLAKLKKDKQAYLDREADDEADVVRNYGEVVEAVEEFKAKLDASKNSSDRLLRIRKEIVDRVTTVTNLAEATTGAELPANISLMDLTMTSASQANTMIVSSASQMSMV